MAFQHSQFERSTTSNPTPVDPGVDQVHQYLMYGLSLPERALRGTAALIGGAINESSALLIPQAFRDSTTYSKFVQEMLDVLNHNVAGVETESDDSQSSCDVAEVRAETSVENQPLNSDASDNDIGDSVEQYVAQKAVGAFLDLAGMATLHLSPITVLAIVSDLAYGSQTYLNELAVELKKEGVIAEDSTIANTAELLDALSIATADTTKRLDTPPISIAGLEKTILDTQAQLSSIDPTKIIPQKELNQIWDDMKDMATSQDMDLLEISSALTVYSLDQLSTATQGALTTVRVTGNLLDQHIFDHYRQGLTRLEDVGIYRVLEQSSRPYIDALWYNFSSRRPTITEDVVSGKWISAVWDGVKNWFKRPKK